MLKLPLFIYFQYFLPNSSFSSAWFKVLPITTIKNRQKQLIIPVNNIVKPTLILFDAFMRKLVITLKWNYRNNTIHEILQPTSLKKYKHAFIGYKAIITIISLLQPPVYFLGMQCVSVVWQLILSNGLQSAKIIGLDSLTLPPCMFTSPCRLRGGCRVHQLI